MKFYSEWRVFGPWRGKWAVYRLKDHRKGFRPGNVIIYDMTEEQGEAAELAAAINDTEIKHHGHE